MRLQISSLIEDTTATLMVVGEIDLATASTLMASMERELAVGDVDRLIVDLAGVTFLDCTGIGVLVRGRELAHKHGHDFRLVGARAMPLTLMRLFGLDAWVESGHAATPPPDDPQPR